MKEDLNKTLEEIEKESDSIISEIGVILKRGIREDVRDIADYIMYKIDRELINSALYAAKYKINPVQYSLCVLNLLINLIMKKKIKL